MVLKATSGSSDSVELEDLCNEEKNPFLLQPSQIVARLVRENSCLWVRDHVSALQFSDDFTSTKLSPLEVEEIVLHMYGIALEMMVSAEYAREGLGDLFVIKCVLVRAMQITQHLTSKSSQDMCGNFHDCMWEIYNALCQPGNVLIKVLSYNLKKEPMEWDLLHLTCGAKVF